MIFLNLMLYQGDFKEICLTTSLTVQIPISQDYEMKISSKTSIIVYNFFYRYLLLFTNKVETYLLFPLSYTINSLFYLSLTFNLNWTLHARFIEGHFYPFH